MSTPTQPAPQPPESPDSRKPPEVPELRELPGSHDPRNASPFPPVPAATIAPPRASSKIASATTAATPTSVARADAADPSGVLLARLLAVLRPRERILTAFSGGIDSTLVAAAARQALGKENAPAALGDSASVPRRELAAALRLAEQLDLRVTVVSPNEQDAAGYQQNAGDRCYFCKSHLYDTLHRTAADLGIRFIANGTNTDDLGDHRPGLDAAREAEVISPLLEAGLDKAQVRAVAKHLGLPNADKPAAACLASRIPYGTPVTPQRLAQVEAAEDALADLGFTGFRVRHHDAIARLEVPWEQVPRLMDAAVRAAVTARLKEIGYPFITLDLEGFRSGSGNVLLTVDGTGTRA